MTFKLDNNHNLIMTKQSVIRQGDIGNKIIFLMPSKDLKPIAKMINGGNIISMAELELIDTENPFKEDLYRYSLTFDTTVAGETKLVIQIETEDDSFTTNEVYIDVEPVNIAYINE